MKKLKLLTLLFVLVIWFAAFKATAQETRYYMLRWSSDGELLAVATSQGVEIYDEPLYALDD